MLYTIGAQVISSKSKEPVSGFYVLGKHGLASIMPHLSKIAEDGSNRIYLTLDPKEAQNLARYLSRLYRSEFRARAKELGTENDDYSFFVLKLPEKRFGKVEMLSWSSLTGDSRYPDAFKRIDRNKIHLCHFRLK